MKVGLIKWIKLTFRSKFFRRHFDAILVRVRPAEDFFHLIFITNALQICYVLWHNHSQITGLKFTRKSCKSHCVKTCQLIYLYVYFEGLKNRALARTNHQQRRPRSFDFVLFIFSVLNIKFETWSEIKQSRIFVLCISNCFGSLVNLKEET